MSNADHRPDVLGPSLTGPRALPSRLGRFFQRADVTGQFARFVAVGGTSTLVYSLLFLLLQGLGTQPANLIGSLASSVLANECHRRLTFRAGGRVGWVTAQLQGGGMSLAALLATSAALTWLDTAVGPTDAVTHLALVVLVNGLVGLVRFAGLRWAFDGHRLVTA